MTDEDQITRTLQAFFDEMGAWEAWCTEREPPMGQIGYTEEAHQQSKAESIAALKKIFRKYCITWNEPNRSIGNTIHFSMIPVYGADLIDILEIDVSGDTARVVTKEKQRTKTTFIYYLKRTDSGWRIEDNRPYLTADGTEEPYSL